MMTLRDVILMASNRGPSARDDNTIDIDVLRAAMNAAASVMMYPINHTTTEAYGGRLVVRHQDQAVSVQFPPGVAFEPIATINLRDIIDEDITPFTHEGKLLVHHNSRKISGYLPQRDRPADIPSVGPGHYINAMPGDVVCRGEHVGGGITINPKRARVPDGFSGSSIEVIVDEYSLVVASDIVTTVIRMKP